MAQAKTFTAVIQDAGNGGAFVDVPFDVEAALGSKRPKVRVTIDDVPYRGILSRMGGEHHILIVLKSIREQIGKTFGDEVTITVEPDTEPRQLELPAELTQAFRNEKQARVVFDSLAYTHRREYVMWISEAKKEETRRSRAAKAIEMLKQGKKVR